MQYLSLKEELDYIGIDSCLSMIENESQIAQIIAELEPKNPEYLAQRNLSLLDSLPQLKENINFYRYLNRFDLKKYIVLNIPSATLSYYNNHVKELEMNVVVGRPKNPTPRIANSNNQRYCSHSIADTQQIMDNLLNFTLDPNCNLFARINIYNK